MLSKLQPMWRWWAVKSFEVLQANVFFGELMSLRQTDVTIEIPENLALNWIDHWASLPECNRNIQNSIFLASCRQDLRMACGLAVTPPPTACYAPILNYCSVYAPGNLSIQPRGFLDPVLPRVSDAFRDSLISRGNIAGNLLGGLVALDALAHSLPANFHVGLQGGQWELYDVNKTNRNNAWGKREKARYPAKMALRLNGANLPSLPAGATSRNGQVRILTPNATTVAGAMRIAGVNRFQPISDRAYKALIGRRVLTGGTIGAALSFGPTLAIDLHSAGGMGRVATNQQSRDQFLVVSAKSQSTNAVGFGAGIAVGAALVAVGVASAPVLIVAGLVAGIAAQTGFVSFGGDVWAQGVMQDMLR
jgi:hypothetical protein